MSISDRRGMTPFAIPECKSCKLRYRCFLYGITEQETMALFTLFNCRPGPTIEAFLVERLSRRGLFIVSDHSTEPRKEWLPCVTENIMGDPILDYDMFVGYFKEGTLWPNGPE